MVFDPESFKEYKEQKRAAMQERQPMRQPRKIHPSEDPFWKGAAQLVPPTASPMSTGAMAQPGPSTTNPVMTSVRAQRANVARGLAPAAPPSEASEVEIPTESLKTPSVKVPEGTILTVRSVTGNKDGEDEAMADQGVLGAHFQSDGMNVQPKKEKGKAVAKDDTHGKGTQPRMEHHSL